MRAVAVDDPARQVGARRRSRGRPASRSASAPRGSPLVARIRATFSRAPAASVSCPALRNARSAAALARIALGASPAPPVHDAAVQQRDAAVLRPHQLQRLVGAAAASAIRPFSASALACVASARPTPSGSAAAAGGPDGAARRAQRRGPVAGRWCAIASSRTSSGRSASRTPASASSMLRMAPAGSCWIRASSARSRPTRSRPAARPPVGSTGGPGRPGDRRPGIGPGRRSRSSCAPRGGWRRSPPRPAARSAPSARGARSTTSTSTSTLNDGVANASTRWVRPLRRRERQSSSSTES